MNLSSCVIRFAFLIKNSGSLEIRFIDLQMHFVLSWGANAGTVIDSLLNVKNILINRGRPFFSPPRAARILTTPLSNTFFVS